MTVMRRLTNSRGALRGAIFLSLAALTMTMTTGTAPATASLLPSVGTPSVPILGQVALKVKSETGQPSGVAVLHGVRRVPGATVIYYSVGSGLPAWRHIS